MKPADISNKTKWIKRLFLVLFTMSVSVTVLPCGLINAHGLFGEVTASAIVEDRDQEIEEIQSKYHEKVQKVKGINIINAWFEFLIAVVCIGFLANLIRLPRGDTIVTLKVRMDN